MGRSNINLAGSAVQGQNLGAGEQLYAGKSFGNTLQFKTLSVTGTTMTITCDDNTIYFSAATGGGGGTTYWSSGTTGLSPAAAEDILLPASDLLKWSDDSCITSANSGLTMCNTTNHIRIDTTNIRICAPTIYLGQSAYYISINSGSKLMCFGAPSCWDLNLCGGSSTDATAAGQVRLIGGGGSSTGCGGDICLCGGVNSSTGKAGSIFLQGGVSTSGTGGDVYLRGGDGSGAGDGTIYLDGANPTGGYGKLVLGSPTTNAAVDSQQIIACGLASNIGINISSKGTCGITLLTGKVALGNTSNAGFVFDCTNSAFCLPKNICICGAGGIASVSCCDGWNIDMRGGFGSSNVGYAGAGGTICICGGCACLGSGGSGAKDGGSVVLHSGPGINGGVDGRIVLDNLPAKSSETCGIYIDASGNLSTGVISGGSGGGFWTQEAGFVHPTTSTDSVIVSNNECYAWSGGSFLVGDSSGCMTLKGNYPSTGVGGDIMLCGGWSNDNTGGDIHLRSGFAYSPGGGGNIYLCPEIGQGGTGRLYIENLVDCTTETCVLYLDSSGRVSKGPAGLTVYNFTSGLTEASGNNVGLGGNMGGSVTLCFDGDSGQEFMICDVGTPERIFAMDDTLGVDAMWMGSTAGRKIAIAGSATPSGNFIEIGCVDGTVETGFYVTSNAAKMQYDDGSGQAQICVNNTGIYTSLTGGTGCVVGVATDGKLSVCSGATGGGGTPGGSNTQVQYNNGGSFSGSSNFTFDGSNVDISGNVCAADFELTSDARCKTCVEELIPTFADIKYKQFELCNCLGQTRFGVIAQELQETYPEVVRTNEEGYLSVSYIDLLVREVAYLKNKIKELENKIG